MSISNFITDFGNSVFDYLLTSIDFFLEGSPNTQRSRVLNAVGRDFFNSPLTEDDILSIWESVKAAKKAEQEALQNLNNEEEVDLDQSGLEPQVPVLDNQTLKQVDFAVRGFENALRVYLDDAGVDDVSSEQILNSFAAAKQNQIDFLPDPDEIQKELESQALAGGGFGVKVSNGLDDISILLGVPLIGGTDPLEIKIKKTVHSLMLFSQQKIQQGKFLKT